MLHASLCGTVAMKSTLYFLATRIRPDRAMIRDE